MRKKSNATVVLALLLSGLLLAGVIEMMWAIEVSNELMFKCSAAASFISYLAMVMALVKCAVKHTNVDAD